jgi:hypothetical protein
MAARKGGFYTLIVTDLLGVFRMPESKPTSTGPMRMQPLERGSIMPTQGLPMMPTAGKAAKTPQPKQQPTRAEAVPSRQSDHNAAKLLAEAAGCPKGQHTALVAGVDFLIKVAKVRQPLHPQAVFVLFRPRCTFSSDARKVVHGPLVSERLKGA